MVDLSNYIFNFAGGSINSTYVINDGDGKHLMYDSILNTICSGIVNLAT